jgi:hypothetical protein
MSKQFRFRINVECDVQNADSESIARTAAFALLTQMQSEKKRGRPSSDVKATITGVSISPTEDAKVLYRHSMPLPMKPRSLDESETTIDEVTE